MDIRRLEHAMRSEKSAGTYETFAQCMHIASLWAVLFGLLLIGSAIAAPPTDEEKKLALNTHNDFRRRVAAVETERFKGPVLIPPLVWDDALAAFAQQWADSEAARLAPLPFEGNTPQHRCPDFPLPASAECQPNNRKGENLYSAWNRPDTPDLSPVRAVLDWFNEQSFYDFDNNTCSAPPNKTCGHYTQVVWAATQRLGCGRSEWQSQDTNAVTFKNVLWVCNYEPPGNIQGQPPYNVPPPPPTGGGTPARVDVKFTKMRVHACPEVGICDWKLSCRLGTQLGTELFNIKECGNACNIPIDPARVLTQVGPLSAEAPVTVTCSVWERDGPFLGLDDPVWEHIGTKAATFTASVTDGTIRITHEDEGDVSVHFDIVPIAATGGGLTVAPLLPPAPTGCRIPEHRPPGCGYLTVECNAPLIGEIRIAGDRGHNIQVSRVTHDSGLIDAEYFGGGETVLLAVCASNQSETLGRCSDFFAATLGSNPCTGGSSSGAQLCPEGTRLCRGRCIPSGSYCTELQ